MATSNTCLCKTLQLFGKMLGSDALLSFSLYASWLKFQLGEELCCLREMAFTMVADYWKNNILQTF